MPRQFTPSQLATITTAELDAMPQADQDAYWRCLVASWTIFDSAYLDGDKDRLASYRRYEIGE